MCFYFLRSAGKDLLELIAWTGHIIQLRSKYYITTFTRRPKCMQLILLKKFQMSPVECHVSTLQHCRRLALLILMLNVRRSFCIVCFIFILKKSLPFDTNALNMLNISDSSSFYLSFNLILQEEFWSSCWFNNHYFLQAALGWRSWRTRCKLSEKEKARHQRWSQRFGWVWGGGGGGWVWGGRGGSASTTQAWCP